MAVITASMLRHAATCDRRLWLDQRDGAATLTPLVAYKTTLGHAHERDVQEAGEAVQVATWAEGVALTAAWMRAGVSLIQQGFLELELSPSVMLRGRADRLVRGRDGGYMPVEIKRYGMLADADFVQLDLYCALAGVTRGEFWLGQPVRRVPHRFDQQRLYQAVDRTLRAVSGDEPPVRIEPHCKECPWYGGCWEIARQSGEIALVSGLRRDSREALYLRGIRTVEQLAQLSPDELRQIRGIKTTAASIRAGAEALYLGQPVWHGELPDHCVLPGVMFDCETDPASGVPWSLGWLEGEAAHVALVGCGSSRRISDGTQVHVVPSPDAAWACMADSLAGSRDPIFHWTGYDFGVLNATAPASVKAALAPRFVDLHRAFSQAVRFPVDGTSLKRVAAYLGYQWRAYESWFAAWEDYRAWLRTGHDDALERSLAYQMDDVIALGKVWEWLSTSR